MFSRFAVPTSFSRASRRSLVSIFPPVQQSLCVFDRPSGHPHRGSCIIRDSTFSNPALLISSSSLMGALPSFCGWIPCRYSWDLSIINHWTGIWQVSNIPSPKAMT